MGKRIRSGDSSQRWGIAWLAMISAMLVGCPDFLPGPADTGTGGSSSATSSSTSGGDGCPGPSTSEWADWPMPNPPNTGLPNPMDYDLSSLGVVVDRVTGLTWQQSMDTNLYTLAAANEYCKHLKLEGPCPWRLPTRVELVSILDFTDGKPAIDTDAFLDTPQGFSTFWTSSPVKGMPGASWSVCFGYGETAISIDTTEFNVRCVR